MHLMALKGNLKGQTKSVQISEDVVKIGSWKIVFEVSFPYRIPMENGVFKPNMNR